MVVVARLGQMCTLWGLLQRAAARCVPLEMWAFSHPETRITLITGFLTTFLVVLAFPLPKPGERSGIRGEKSPKSWGRQSSYLWVSHITSFICLIIQKAGKLTSGPDHSASKWVFGFTRNGAEDQRTIRYSTQIDLHILDCIKHLKIILTTGHRGPCVVKIQNSPWNYVFICGAWTLIARQTLYHWAT